MKGLIVFLKKGFASTRNHGTCTSVLVHCANQRSLQVESCTKNLQDILPARDGKDCAFKGAQT